MPTPLLLKDLQIFDRDIGKLTKATLLIKDGVFQVFALPPNPEQLPALTTIIDLKGYHAFPGFVDMQVHLRSPGQEYKEDLLSGSMAAARGGFTQVACMPNTAPTLDSDHLSELVEIVESFSSNKSNVEIFPIPSISQQLKGQQLSDFRAYAQHPKLQGWIKAVTDDGLGVESSELMREAFLQARQYQLSLMQHAETPSLSRHGSFSEGQYISELKKLATVALAQTPQAVLPSSNELLSYVRRKQLEDLAALTLQNPACEVDMVGRDLGLLSQIKGHYHALHVSTQRTMEAIMVAKEARLPVSCEVTPHHLLLDHSHIHEHAKKLIENGDTLEGLSLYKMNPPLQTPQDREFLISALAHGHIDLVSSDHAPHSVQEKRKLLSSAPFGITGLELSFPLLYTHLYLKQKISLPRLIDAYCFRAIHLFRLGARDIYQGARADLVVIDPQTYRNLGSEPRLSKSSNNPFFIDDVYKETPLTGFPILTLCRGEITYVDWQRVEALKNLRPRNHQDHQEAAL